MTETPTATPDYDEQARVLLALATTLKTLDQESEAA